MDPLAVTTDQEKENEMALRMDEDDEDDNNEDDINNSDSGNMYESDSIVKISQQALVETTSTTANKKNKTKNSRPVSKRRQTVHTMDLRQLVLRNNNNIREKLMQNMNKHQVIVDYNVLAFLENIELENDSVMETKMKKFIEDLKKTYKSIQHIEYKIDNKLYCAIDLVYFLPIIFSRFHRFEKSVDSQKILESIVKRLEIIDERLKRKNLEMPETPKAEVSAKRKRKAEATKDAASEDKTIEPIEEVTETADERNVRLYTIGNGDFYLMCRKKQNFVDGQKNLEKKYGKCKLLKTWNNRTDVKDIGKLILVKFPQMKWNARTNILTNLKGNQVTENELVNYLVKVLK